jgi:uncharacterized membrane protein (DUF2068 family)
MAEQRNQTLAAPHNRPLGLRLGAVLLLLFSIFGLLGAFAGLFTPHNITPLIAFYILDGMLSLLELTLVWALWSLKSWAFWTTVSVEGICIVLALSSFTIGRPSSSPLTNLVFPLAILLCLFVDPSVRPAFRTRAETMPVSEPPDASTN